MRSSGFLSRFIIGSPVFRTTCVWLDSLHFDVDDDSSNRSRDLEGLFAVFADAKVLRESTYWFTN